MNNFEKMRCEDLEEINGGGLISGLCGAAAGAIVGAIVGGASAAIVYAQTGDENKALKSAGACVLSGATFGAYLSVAPIP